MATTINDNFIFLYSLWSFSSLGFLLAASQWWILFEQKCCDSKQFTIAQNFRAKSAVAKQRNVLNGISHSKSYFILDLKKTNKLPSPSVSCIPNPSDKQTNSRMCTVTSWKLIINFVFVAIEIKIHIRRQLFIVELTLKSEYEFKYWIITQHHHLCREFGLS